MASLGQTGHLRAAGALWRAGNRFLEQWLHDHGEVAPPIASDLASLEVSAQRGAGRAGLDEPLSERERAVLRLVAAGLRNGEIAGQLIVSENTIKVHLKRSYRKLGVSDRVQAINRGRQLREI